MTGSEYSQLFGRTDYTHPHSWLLYLLMSGGIILVIVFIVGIIYADRKLCTNGNNIYSKIILFTMYSFFVMGIAESLVGTVLLYPMLVFAMHADCLTELKYENKKTLLPRIKLNIH